MLTQIIQHAPTWVWALLAGLIALGISQTFPRSMTIRRATIIPVAMVALSVFGVTSVFGAHAVATAAWAVALATAVALSAAVGAWRGIAWSAQDQRLQVPGSWWPLMLILGIFTTKFGVGATIAMHPALAHDPLFGAVAGLAYGSFAGVFLSRGVAMWKVAHEALTASA
ncbi:MAG: hypothetical protein JF606_09630 [Burkholderiales bacterium]|jgi:hypothetical protein|nr:hypothetical protein [Burkholderiales bacterium]